MTAQPSINEQQASTQKTMNMMMPIMIFVFSIQFPAGLALYWVISNLFQLVQQFIVLNSSKNPKEEL
jgi:YidC/Oxa1 family membrane protein insertase